MRHWGRKWPTFVSFGAILSAMFVLNLAVNVNVAAAANTAYYVNCSAGSNGSGTQSSPWNTLASVNAHTFGAGDSILFDRGTTCSGSLNPPGSGSSGSPITIDAYGTGALPIISAGSNQYAIKLSNQSYWTIQDIETTGGTTYGVFITSTAGNYSNFTLNNLVVTGVTGGTLNSKDTGLVIVSPTHDSSNSTAATLSNITINNVTAYSTTMWAGIEVGTGTNADSWAGNSSLHENNVTIENSTVHDVYGDGIVAFTSNNATLEDNVAYNTGEQPTQTIGTPNAIWTWACNTCTVENNEAYDSHSPGVDGGDFDIDYYNTNNTVEYNYGHDAQGYCVGIFGGGSSFTTTNAVVRYNICANNSRLAGNNQGDFYAYSIGGGPISGLQIYNNTSYWNPATSTEMTVDTQAADLTGTDFFKNNVIYSTGSVFTWSSTSLQYDYNDYWYTGSGTPKWYWGNTAYSGLSAWQTGTGQDAHSMYANPNLSNPTYHTTGISGTAAAFTPQSGSPVIDAGTNVGSMGSHDFAGNTIPQGNGYDMGAIETSGSGGGSNLLANPGFETGTLSGWSSQAGSIVGSSLAHSGSYAGEAGSGGGLWQNITGLQANHTYTFSGWVESADSSEGIFLFAKNFGGTEVDSSYQTSTGYTFVSIQFTTGSSSTSAQVGVWRSSGSGNAYADDLSLS
jgi:Right handed beta helix region